MNDFKSPWFYARIFVGLVFAYAGFTKLAAPIENFRGLVASYEIIPYALSPLIAHTLPWIELIFGIFMISGYATRLSSLILAGLCFSFLILLGFSGALVKGGDCGCFGEGALIHLSTRQMFAVDSFNFILAVRLYFLKQHPLSLDGILKKQHLK